MEQNRGGDTKILKREKNKLGQGMSALKRGGAGTPLQTMFCRRDYVICIDHSLKSH